MENNLFMNKGSAWLSAFFILCFAFFGFAIVGPLVGYLLVQLFTHADVLTFQEKLFSGEAFDHEEYAGMKVSLFVMQGCATLVGLFFMPLMYMKFLEKKSFFSLWQRSQPGTPVLLAGLIVIAFMIPNSFFVEWNAGLSLPELFKNVETWARLKEQQAEQVTIFLTKFHSFGEFIVTLLIVAVLPGMGEELLFRGILQPKLEQATRNVHVAILISAVLFSTMHMQFFGFVPRMLLGMLFGYLYYWSNNIWVPMVAHFVNNGFALTMLYLYQLNLVAFDVESKESAPLSFIAFGAIVTFVLLFYFKRMTSHFHNSSQH